MRVESLKLTDGTWRAQVILELFKGTPQEVSMYGPVGRGPTEEEAASEARSLAAAGLMRAISGIVRDADGRTYTGPPPPLGGPKIL